MGGKKDENEVGLSSRRTASIENGEKTRDRCTINRWTARQTPKTGSKKLKNKPARSVGGISERANELTKLCCMRYAEEALLGRNYFCDLTEAPAEGEGRDGRTDQRTDYPERTPIYIYYIYIFINISMCTLTLLGPQSRFGGKLLAV